MSRQSKDSKQKYIIMNIILCNLDALRREKKKRFTNHSYVAVGVAMQTRIGMVVIVHFS